MSRRTLIIGDVHGHYDRLADLLVAAGILDDDLRRVDHETEVVQLGDLGHFGTTGSPTGDRLCWQSAWNWIDLVLWGNHDRAVVSERHAFSGYQRPDQGTIDAMRRMDDAGRIRFAHGACGYLITHAGLHAANQRLVDDHDRDAAAIARRLNSFNTDNGDYVPVLDNISFRRGGRAHWGGILWCDWREKRVRGIPQVLGHTVRARKQRVRRDSRGSWNIDVGTSTNGQLAALRLPELEVVDVKRPDWGPGIPGT